MNTKLILMAEFRRDLKKLVKKYRSLTREIQELGGNLLQNPRKGVEIKENVYKIRLAVKSKGRGKSGGMRVITYVHLFIRETTDDDIEIYLLTIYDKSEFETVPDKMIVSMVSQIQSAINQRFEDEDASE